MVEGCGGLPVTLIVGAPRRSLGIDTDSVVHAETGAEGRDLSILFIVENPAAIFDRREVPTPASEFGIVTLSVNEGWTVVRSGSYGEVVTALAIW